MKINLFYDTTEGITKFTTLESEYILFSRKLVIVPAGFESDGAGGVFRRGHKQHHDRHQHC